MKLHLSKTTLFAGFILCVFGFCVAAVSAPPGDIAGVVKDAQSGDPLPGANVILVGTAIGSSTDLNGRYAIKAVPPGTYTLRVTYIGYETKDVSLTVGADGQVNMDVSLVSTVVEAETVFVWGQREGQMAAINQQLTANSIMNVVAADRIQELPDQNVAESISRLPGISVRRSSGEAQKIVIRGLEPKLNAITVNGVRIPATDTEDRSVDLSMISSELLEAIEVFKAPAPDMDAEAVGGIVNLRVKKAPEQRKAMLRLNSGYNRLAEDYGDYKAIGEYSQRFSNNKIGLVAGFNYERANRGSERQGASFSIADNNRPIGIRGTSLNIENTDEIRRRWGASATLDYAFSRGTIWLTNFYTTTSRNPFSIEKQYNAAGDNVRYIANYSEIDLKALSSSINGEMRLFGMDLDWTASRYHAQTNNDFESQLTFTEGSPFGSALFNPDDPATYAQSAKNNLDNTNLNDAYFRPDTTKETDYAAHLNLQLPLRLGKKVAGFLKFGGKYSRIDRQRDDYGIGEAFYYLGGSFITDAQARASYPLILAPQTGRINVRNFIDSETASKKIVDDTFDLFPLFNRERIKNWAVEQRDTFHFERTTLVNDYDARETIAAGYVMAKLDFGQFLTIIPGVRYERSDNRYDAVWSSAWEVYGSYGEQRDTSSTQQYDHWFPHLHVRVKPLSWFDLRLSANRTIARPNFSWVSPRTRLDPSNRNINRGNPDLKEATSWNYDVATSFYSNKIGLFTIGGFYKNLSNIFYQKSTIVYKAEDIKALGIPGDERGYPMTSFANSDKAKVWGLEVDLQTRLEFVPGLPRFLRGVVLNANFARIWSETLFPGPPQIVDSLISIRPPRSVIVKVIEPTRTGPMPGQAKYLTNFSVGYDIGGLSARLSALYQGESINSIGAIAETDTWNGDFWRWDASVKYRLSRLFSLNFNLVNIGGEPDQTFFGGPDLQTRLVSQSASSTQRYLTNHFNYGMTASAGIQLNY